MTQKKVLIGVLFILFLSTVGLFLKLNKLEKQYQQTVDELFFTKPQGSNTENRLFELIQTVSLLNSQVETLQSDLTEFKFFSKNKDHYSLNGKQFGLSHCCTGNGILNYDFFLEDPPGSGNLFDFGTSSYITFADSDIIKSFNVVPVGGVYPHQIYKIIINSNLRYSEGIVFPQRSEYGVFYNRLYSVKEDFLNYRASI